MKRIGILGGTFNPIHNGHLLIAEGLVDKLKLDRIIFIPCAIPPLKNSKQLINARHRLEMVKRAVKGHSRFSVASLEIDRGGVSYSVDTLTELRRQFKAKLYFIVGSDSLTCLSAWKDIGKVLSLAQMVAVSRPGYPVIPAQVKRKIRIDWRRVKLVEIPTLSISSTEVRSLTRSGRSLKFLVPEQVRKYILRYRLYKK